jgi:hypothetical protein
MPDPEFPFWVKGIRSIHQTDRRNYGQDESRRPAKGALHNILLARVSALNPPRLDLENCPHRLEMWRRTRAAGCQVLLEVDDL